jgi:hypothetical protein
MLQKESRGLAGSRGINGSFRNIPNLQDALSDIGR